MSEHRQLSIRARTALGGYRGDGLADDELLRRAFIDNGITYARLKQSPNCGKATIEEIKGFAAGYGLFDLQERDKRVDVLAERLLGVLSGSASDEAWAAWSRATDRMYFRWRA